MYFKSKVESVEALKRKPKDQPLPPRQPKKTQVFFIEVYGA